MVHDHTKNKMLMIEAMFAVMLLIFIGAFALNKFFPTPAVQGNPDVPGIVGFVPVEIKSQPINLIAQEPTSFILFSEKEEPFELTSLRLSGMVIGEGRAEIVLDNGLGQELLVYSNLKQKQGNLITGMAVTSDQEGEPLPEGAKIENVEPQKAWLKITPDSVPIRESPVTELTSDKQTVSGDFDHACLDTCYMNMKLQKGLYYTLKVRVDAGTEVRINELKYMLEV